MVTKIYNQSFFAKVKQMIYHSILLVLLILPISIYSQLRIDTITPMDMALIARDVNTGNGKMQIKGKIDNTSGFFNYDTIKIEVYRGKTFFTIDSINHILIGTYSKLLNFNNNIASFDFQIPIKAELFNFSFKIIGKNNSTKKTLRSIKDIIAGDVYVIQGQSNALADMQDPPGESANLYQDYFIRTFGGTYEGPIGLLNHNKWYVAHGDGPQYSEGNIGQWGLKLANLILEMGYPIAIFNAAHSSRNIMFFQRPIDYQTSLDSNYGRLYYRLNKTGLKENIRALFWSQGENDVDIGTTTDQYINSFNALKQDWLADYPNIRKFYIFQTKSACGDISAMQIKEAQRLLTANQANQDIHIMQTAALKYAPPISGPGWTADCHFTFIDGYEEFANRIYKLVKRDFYGGTDVKDFETPMILDAYLTDDHTLVVETDAAGLIMNDPVDNFQVTNATIIHIEVSGSSIILTLSNNPGLNSSVTHLGFSKSVINNARFITNTNNIELVSFNQFPIDVSLETVWNGNTWTHNKPVKTMSAILDANYNTSNGNIVANHLTINSGVNLNFVDNPSSTKSIVVHGDLTINGTFTIGDQESLVMYKDDAIIIGEITKKESSTPRNNTHDFTYWSSPVENVDAQINSVFTGVTPSRIFYFDQSMSLADAADQNHDTYWDVWVNAPGNYTMNPGQGFATEGESGTIGVHNISFTGKPNNGVIFTSVVYQNDELDNDYNMIGNPYPSAINIEDFFAANSNIDPVIYLWTHNTPINAETGDFVSSDYAIYDFTGGTATGTNQNDQTNIPQKNIGSSQGFFIRTTNSSPSTVVFNNSMRIENANDQFFKANIFKTKKKDKGEEKDRIWLNLITDQGGFNQILIGFMKNATKDIDRGFDASKFEGSKNPISFYSVIKNEKYVIQGLPTFKTNEKVSLGFDTNVAPRIFTISIAKTERAINDTDVYLVDNVLHVTHDLKDSDYHFSQKETGEFTDRFILQFIDSAIDVDEINLQNSFIISHDLGNLNIQSDILVKHIKVYDLLGKLIMVEKPNKRSFQLKTSHFKGSLILLIEATLENDYIIRRKTLKF